VVQEKGASGHARGQTILVVDDDPLFCLAIGEVLGAAGYAAATAASGHDALAWLRQGTPGLILLDIGLPDVDGLGLLHLLRLQAPGVPIIVLTARRERHSLVVGLNAGADDYLTKPPDPDELVARVGAVLRRASDAGALPHERLTVGDVTLDATRHLVQVRGQQIELSPKEFNLLWLLASNAGRVVPRPFILDTVWGDAFYGDVKALDVYIRLLRRKIEADPDHPRLIATVRGVGYSFAPPDASGPAGADRPAGGG
jgi:DNA-binding response OmpR family regulator